MSCRSSDESIVEAFLARAGLAGAHRQPLPGDASTRRYERLHLRAGGSLMLMSQARAAESPPCEPGWSAVQREAAGWNATARLSAGRIEAFASTAAYLRALGLSAPAIQALDPGAGLAVIEDLGDSLFARRLERTSAGGDEERELYFAAVDVLARLHAQDPPAELTGHGQAWPLLDYDGVALRAGVDLFLDWYPRLDARVRVDAGSREEWDALWAPIVKRGAEGASVFAHRDYHAENLLWLRQRDGPARVGLVDFQDAVRAHPTWDLHTLLQDARRDVAPELERAALERYLDLRPEPRLGLDREAFLADYAALAAANQARILGVFARLVVRDAKPRYRGFLTRAWGNLRRDLRSPGLEGLRAWFDRHAPGLERAAA